MILEEKKKEREKAEKDCLHNLDRGITMIDELQEAIEDGDEDKVNDIVRKMSNIHCAITENFKNLKKK